MTDIVVAEGPVGKTKRGEICIWADRFELHSKSLAPPPEKYADDQGGDFDCEILVYEPPHRLDFSWPSEQGNPPTEVSVQLSERDGQVHLLLRHTRLESAEFINGASAGWHAHLDLLEDNLYGRKVTDFWPLHTALEDEYAKRLG